MRRGSWRPALVLWMTALAAASAASRAQDDDSLWLLDAVSSRVEAYYLRAQSIICVETVRLQPLDSNWSAHEMGRTLVYDLRIEWDRLSPGGLRPEPQVIRKLRTINGRVPKAHEEPACVDPKPVTPDALAMLLPARRREYVFKFAGNGKVKDRVALMFDYRGRTPGPADIKWKGECVSIDLPGRYRGRVWVDPDTDDVLRFDEQLASMFEFPVPREHTRFGRPITMIVERADSSTHYRPVAFHDPEEILMLPESIDTLQVLRNAEPPRLRITQTFSDYRRFITGGRLVK